MNAINVNPGDCGGLKQYLANTVPVLLWVGSSNHKLTLCSNYLLSCYVTIRNSVTLHDIRICAKLLLKATINLLHH